MFKYGIRITIKLLRLAVLFVLLAVILLGVVSLNPRWLTEIIEQQLAGQGIDVQLQQLSGHWQGGNYQLHAQLDAQVPTAGVAVQNAVAEVSLDWQAAIRGQAFISQLLLAQAQVQLDSQKLRNYQSSKTATKKLSRHQLQRFLPLAWQVRQTAVGVDGYSISVRADGKQDDEMAAQLSDSSSGKLSLHYNRQAALLLAESEQFDLQPLSGYQAVLHDLTLTINTRNWWQSRADTSLVFQGLNSKISLFGKDKSLYLQAAAGGKSLALTATPTLMSDGETAGIINFNDADLSVLEVIKSLAPASLSLPTLGGHISGEVVVGKKGVYSADVSLRQASLRHAERGFSNVSGRLKYQRDTVYYNLQLAHSEVVLPQVFPLAIAPLSGKATGSVEINKRVLSFTDVQLSNDDIEQFKLNGSVDLHRRQMDLQASLDNANLSKRRHYLPPQMPNKLRAWLQQALRSGQNNHADLTLHGPFKQFFRHPEMTFKLDVSTSDTVLRYSPNNPDISIKQGRVVIDGLQLSIDIPDASLGGLPVHVSANIDNLLEAVLHVNAHLPGVAAKSMLKVAKNSVAAKAIKTVQKIVKVDGKVKLDLALTMKLRDKKSRHRFKVVLSSKSAQATLQDYPDITVRAAQLQVLVNENGLLQVNADGYSDKAKKLPLNIAIRRNQARDYDVLVDTSANAINLLQAAQLLAAKPAQLAKRYQLITGTSAYKLRLLFDNKGKFKSLSASSDLHGTALRGFGLLYKSKDNKLPLSVDYDAAQQQLRVGLQKRLAAHLLLHNKQVQGLTISNRKAKPQAKSGQVSLAWHGKQFDLTRFNRFRQELMPLLTTGKKRQTPLQYYFDVSMQAAKLDNNNALPLKLKGYLHDLQVASPLLSGTVSYRPDHLNASLSRVELSSLFDLLKRKEINPGGRQVTTVDFAKTLPQMDISVAQVIWHGKNVGKAVIHTSVHNGNYSIDQILLNGSSYFAEISGYESKEPQGMTTHAQIVFKGEKIKDIIEKFQLNPVLDGKFIDVVLNLSWPGKAHTVNLRKSYGKATLSAQNIKMRTVSSNVGGVLGLMDIVGILKRISMDFKNLSSSKISFDSIGGKWNIGGGRAITSNAYANGSLIDLKVEGAIDLYRRTFDDVDIKVIPQASNIIPVVGAVAGGVVGAAAGFVVQQVVGDKINSVVGLPYVVSGNWLEPVVTFGGQDEEKTKKQHNPMDFIDSQRDR